MKKLIETMKDLHWVDNENYTVELYMSDELPEFSLCTSAYGIVFKNGMLLQTELREGERPERRLDIPGGHLDPGETLEQTVVRETYEETGVHVFNPQLVAFLKVTCKKPKGESHKYPYPISYLVYYLCDIESEEDFNGNEDAHGRVWLKPEEFKQSIWCRENRVLLEEIIKLGTPSTK